MTANGYEFLFLAGLTSLVLPFGLLALSRLLARRALITKRPEEDPAFLDRIRNQLPSDIQKVGVRFNSRFFHALNLTLGLVTVAVLLIPLVQALDVEHSAGLVIVTTVLCFFLVLYLTKKGDLSWLHATSRDRPDAADRGPD